ncbi:uncharacterized protein LOC116204243 [Punica granatum]|uniref:Uncharacterized protein n=2 Tax=Punica granatum TaxID=22663 RepID=A0A2I0JKL2_PUNGR|nr:uncharacterized protein LOC116204243 [Punica granatum]PKI56811.1 hypothetical protein CRG98_022769 [Punica granatum]
MPEIDPSIITHRFGIKEGVRPVVQKVRPLARGKLEAVKVEVQKLKKARFIREVRFQSWVANIVLVTKSNGKWRTCMNYTDFNKSYLKDAHSLSLIDQLVDSTLGSELLTFMDTYSRYNQIRMLPLDEEHTAFYIDNGVCCCKHRMNLEETFVKLRKYQMKLNLEKCAFGVQSGKLFGFMIIQRGIEANPENVQAILDMASLKSPYDV